MKYTMYKSYWRIIFANKDENQSITITEDPSLTTILKKRDAKDSWRT